MVSQLADAAILGCAFNNQGQLNSRGDWEPQYGGCPNALQEWAADENAFQAQAVVVELGTGTSSTGDGAAVWYKGDALMR